MRAFALSALMLATFWSPALGQSEPPMLGATLNPTSLSMTGREVSAQIQNRGNIPVTITALAFLAPTLPATGWKVTVEPSTLAPMETATVTLRSRARTPLANLSLDILMGPQTRTGMDSTALRFPVPVTVTAATSKSRARAVLAALLGSWTTLSAQTH